MHETGNGRDNLTVKTGKAMMRLWLAGIAIVSATREPSYAGFALSPGEKWCNARRSCFVAPVLPVMDNQSWWKRRGIAKNIDHIVAVARVIGEKSGG